MLTTEQRAELAPLVGEIVLRFAVLEGETVRLAKAAFADPRAPNPLSKWPFSELVKHLAGQFDAIGEAEAADRLRRGLVKLQSINSDRIHVVHGEWFWRYSADAVGTRKTDRAGDYEAVREWNPQTLRRLIDEIKDATAVLCGVDRIYRKRTRSSMVAMKRP